MKDKNRLISFFVWYLFLSSYLLAVRGDLLSTEVMATRDLTNNQTYVDGELSALADDSFFGLDVSYGFWMYKITYETINATGESTIASGVIAYPRVDWPDIADEAFSILSYQHGTVIEKSAVTSEVGLWILPALIAGYGYVYVEPDYIGLGISDGLHPYQIKEPYGTDVVDIIRATRQFSDASNDFQVNSQIFLAGYSEGGYATMATHQVIERDHINEFSITASFPMAGAYSMSGVMTDVMLNYTPYGQPYYFPYVLAAYTDNYPNSLDAFAAYLLPEYALVLPDLFDGVHSADEINEIMPEIPITIMKPDSILSFQNIPNHPLRVELQNNDLFDWTPIATMYIIHGAADELVPIENAEIAYETFIENGSENVHMEILPENLGGHQDAAPFALLGAFQLSEELHIINVIGDINEDTFIDILDIIHLVDLIITNSGSSYEYWASNINQDENIDIFDIVILINTIL